MNNETVELADVVATIRNGANLVQHDRPDNGMLPISRIETISDGTIDWTRVNYASPPQGDYLLRSGDILFSHINSPEHIGKTALFDTDREMIHGINLLLLRVDRKRCDPKYLNYYLKSSDVRVYFRARCKRAVNQASLNQSDILSLRLPLPDLIRQRALAFQLDQADHLRRRRRYALQMCDELLPASFLKLFGNHFKKGPSRPFGELVKITGGGTPSRDRPEFFQGRIPWLTSKDMRADYIWDTEEHITQDAIENSATNLVSANSILVVVKSKILMHRLPVAIAKVPMCHGQDIKSIQCQEGLNYEFARFVLKYYERRLLNLARGANTEGLTLPMLEELPVPEVEIGPQERFATIVAQHGRLRATHVEALRQADHLFQTLLHQAFSDSE